RYWYSAPGASFFYSQYRLDLNREVLEPDGFFGNDTEKAVRQFQQQKGLMADGVVGAQTRKELGL
ncbi:peptidoglycan-binding domain-containing protein, partial [Microcoleus sp. A2-C5]|uniref:peptidoglycan-binding domain-containing protein n=1 Tax=unclassified Microcoleus TaxID=2642155 RepID=UPI002FD14287